MARAITRVLALLFWALVAFGLGLLPGGRYHSSIADLLGFWEWALTVAFVTVAIALLPLVDKVLAKTGRIHDVSHDDSVYWDSTLVSLHDLGATRVVWDAYPGGDGSLEIGSLRLLDSTGKSVRTLGYKALRPRSSRWKHQRGWADRIYEDAAYELANRYSVVPGHYVLDLPAGTVISAPSRTEENEEETYGRGGH
jgi:hypothetical protein